MKKTEYKAPVLEVIKLKAPIVLQAASDGNGSTTNPDNPIQGGEGWD